MKKGEKMKKPTMATLVLTTLTLVACSHQNPLTQKQVSPQQVADFLYQAAKFSGKAVSDSINGTALYVNCMDSASRDKKCKKLYSAMVIYAKNNQKYGSLNLSDISDQTMWGVMRDYYQKDQYFDVQY